MNGDVSIIEIVQYSTISWSLCRSCRSSLSSRSICQVGGAKTFQRITPYLFSFYFLTHIFNFDFRNARLAILFRFYKPPDAAAVINFQYSSFELKVTRGRAYFVIHLMSLNVARCRCLRRLTQLMTLLHSLFSRLWFSSPGQVRLGANFSQRSKLLSFFHTYKNSCFSRTKMLQN
jgi:hypothetical protein